MNPADLTTGDTITYITSVATRTVRVTRPVRRHFNVHDYFYVPAIDLHTGRRYDAMLRATDSIVLH